MGVFQEYSETQILQMIGRAGRPQVFSFIRLEINQQRRVQLEHLLVLSVSKSLFVYLSLVCRFPDSFSFDFNPTQLFIFSLIPLPLQSFWRQNLTRFVNTDFCVCISRILLSLDVSWCNSPTPTLSTLSSVFTFHYRESTLVFLREPKSWKAG